ncbi:MAG: hypothetical protein WBA77_02290 [Microcoleaceae cyanobacterium]
MKIPNLVKRVKNWFPKAQEQIKEQANELEAKLTDSNLDPLSPEQRRPIEDHLFQLDHPQPHIEAIATKLNEQLEKWQQGSDRNCLVVLCHPIENISTLLEQTLASGKIDPSLKVHPLSWSHRPLDYSTILSELQDQIHPPETNPTQPQLQIIPDLSWCFLRCLYGLDGVEWLQHTLFKDQSQFWLIGCNDWMWHYLNRVYQWSTYFENTLSLPALEPVEIKHWLEPVREKLNFDFDFDDDDEEDDDDEDLEDSPWECIAERQYFKRLAKVSLGTAPTVAQLWLHSLQQQDAEDLENTPDAHVSAESSSQPIVLARVTLPKLPQLTKEERYLLFSIGLHGNLTLKQLALSLGNETTLAAVGESPVTTQVQVLKRAGLIQNQQGWLSIHPVHYPRLRNDLEANHFLVD